MYTCLYPRLQPWLCMSSLYIEEPRGSFGSRQVCRRSPDEMSFNNAFFSIFSTAYTISKYGMSMCVLGMAEEFREFGIAVNALWPKMGL